MDSLSRALAGMFDRPFAKLPIDLQKRVERAFFPFSWDRRTSQQRRQLAEGWDAQHPRDLAAKEKLKLAFRKGYKKVSVPRRNKQNAKRPRPSRQKVPDADLLRVKRKLDAESIPLHKQCSKAYEQLAAGRMTMRGFRKRWNCMLLRAGAPGKGT